MITVVDGGLIPPALKAQSCRLCGLRRGRAETDAEWVVDVPHAFESVRQLEVQRDADGSTHYTAPERPFSRRHVGCEPTAAFVVAAVTGVDLAEPDAAEVLRRHGVGLLAGDRQATARQPWGHVTATEREKVTALARAQQAPPEQDLPPAGRCGVCGTSRSTAWVQPGLFWEEDGTVAPVCADCAKLLPFAMDLELLRVRALAEVSSTRATPSLSAHRSFGFRMAAEVLRGDERHLDGAGRWEYRPEALAEVREAVRAHLPELILDRAERAAGVEALERRRLRAADEAARREAAAVVGASGW